MKKIFALLFSCVVLSAAAQVGDGHPRGLRGAAPLDKEVATPLMPKMINDGYLMIRSFLHSVELDQRRVKKINKENKL